MKLYISAGHTGAHTGSCYKYGDEGALTIDFRNRVIQKLAQKGISCYKDNDKVSLTTVINDVNAKLSSDDIAIEFHFDASTKPDRNGSTIYVADAAGAVTKNLAFEMIDIVTKTLGTRNLGVRSERLSYHQTLGFLSKTKPHALLIELCFVSNEEDMKKYHNNKDELASKIAEYLSRK